MLTGKQFNFDRNVVDRCQIICKNSMYNLIIEEKIYTEYVYFKINKYYGEIDKSLERKSADDLLICFIFTKVYSIFFTLLKVLIN